MTGTKHPKWKKPTDADLANNPGIGTSKGMIKEGDEVDLEGENTGGINPRQKMRTNK
ncbi:hypothetical protein [Mesorhizobium sp. dw_380]|uniref:hypothetical protein n=1 Tax=Mesorhizobium sp. dw_380 TaxID=2812001 RepID=UPI001BDF0060|nr:hypothetical protein [Mesorhizobium sp. dw_380]